jgi:alpha-tubulin suppressor-like RCC1 family protein
MPNLRKAMMGAAGAAGGGGYTLWAWGLNDTGVLGQGDVIDRSSPVQIGTDSDWASISAGNVAGASGGEGSCAAVKTDGTLWTWGLNDGAYNGDGGQLGLGDTVNRSSPTQVGALTTWRACFMGYGVALGFKTDGTAWVWGDGEFGSMGRGSLNESNSSPIQLGSLTDWSSDTHLNAWGGSRNFFVLKPDGTIWAWGQNGDGELGLGNTTQINSPTQVGALTTWYRGVGAGPTQFVNKDDGTMWVWGKGNFGQLGQGDTANSSSPIQLGSLTNWKYGKEASQIHSIAGGIWVFIVKGDGTAWTWGYDSANRGTGGRPDDKVRKSSPVQVGSLTTWSMPTQGYTHAMAVTTSGALFTWGRNGSGQLGQSDVIYRSSPVQVGSLTDWKLLAAVRNVSVALKPA